MIEARECLHKVLGVHHKGTFAELLENIVRSLSSSRNGDFYVDSVIGDFSFSEIIDTVLLVGLDDKSYAFMGPNYSALEVYQLANGEFAVLESNFETQPYSVVAFDESLAQACQTIGEEGLAEFGENGPVIYNPGGEIDPESTTERNIAF